MLPNRSDEAKKIFLSHGFDKHLRKMKQLGTTALLAALFLGQLAGCAMSGSVGPTAQAVDDATITAGVKAAIVRDPALKATEIDVGTEQGVVKLSGFVGSADSVAAVASVARTVKGVRSVRNDLRLK
ncbi:BON domain-containing protein [Massilia sp. H6]|uniref:BON domain-containing protein n=1 Tax=Massilia sp. H6 TaxID=2970464 RepID=UPI002169DBD5|nr:BON domain-containing protein [Massilia sp. H6]UVW30136.1 BON domain-containing protein [Massilia sp. H6]